MDKILIITNPYNHAKTTLEYGINLANDMGSEVNVLHVLDRKEEEWFPGHAKEEPYPQSETYNEMFEKEKDIRREQLKTWINEISENIRPAAPINLMVDVGFLRFTLRNYLKNNEVSMILVCQHPESRHNYGISLSQSFKVPVMICAPETTYIKPENLVFGTNYHEKDIAILKSLTNFAQKLEAHIQVVHITRKADYKDKLQAAGFQRQMKEQVQYNALQFQNPDYKNIHTGILGVAENSLAQAIVLVKRKKNLLQEIMSKHTVRQIVNAGDRPVLLFPSN